MTNYIQKLTGVIKRAQGYNDNGFELVVTVSFDSKQFSSIKKKQDPLALGMIEIKYQVYSVAGVSGHPSYTRASYSQQFPRASKGLVTLDLTFNISKQDAERLGADTSQWSLYHSVDLNKQHKPELKLVVNN